MENVAGKDVCLGSGDCALEYIFCKLSTPNSAASRKYSCGSDICGSGSCARKKSTLLLNTQSEHFENMLSIQGANLWGSGA